MIQGANPGSLYDKVQCYARHARLCRRACGLPVPAGHDRPEVPLITDSCRPGPRDATHPEPRQEVDSEPCF